MKVMVNVLQSSDCHFSVRILFETGKASDIWISFHSETQNLSSQVFPIERESWSREGRAHTGNIYIFSDQDWVKPFRIKAMVLAGVHPISHPQTTNIVSCSSQCSCPKFGATPPEMSADRSGKLTQEILHIYIYSLKEVKLSFHFHCYFMFDLFKVTDIYGSFFIRTLYFIFVLIKSSMYITNPE